MQIAEDPGFGVNRVHLQQGSLKVLTLAASAMGYIALIFLIWPETGARAVPAAWGAALFLVSGAGLAYLLCTRRLRLASHLFVWSVVASVLCLILVRGEPDVASLFAVPVIFASLLIGGDGILPPAVAAVLLTLTVSVRSLAMPLLSVDVWLPAVVIVLVTLAAWLSARNLNTALAWLWSDYVRANESERMALEPTLTRTPRTGSLASPPDVFGLLVAGPQP